MALTIDDRHGTLLISSSPFPQLLCAHIRHDHSMHCGLVFIVVLLPTTHSWIVDTTYGLLRGMPIQAADGQKCHIFKGVPIARPPLGKRRFKLPEPPDIWEGVRNATLYSAACISNSTVSSSVQKHISEDCLYMNTHSCPVVFYVHGGSLNYDSAVMFDDKYITDRYSSNGLYMMGYFIKL
ncbi:unnamed protein product [Heligmosomoides polygyrus]|uniref:COesterase domain-containing protein n=1 Tax=Heligmosomoides polygyrus TaxID=6339 RepID=A0A183FTW4_HELPZ|nr:unnamed protein product [Heligmosomoides polygyrus]